VLLVTTTVRVINRVHGNTTHLGPLVSLDAVLVECTTSFQDRLIGSSTTGNQTDHGTAVAADSLLATRWKSDTSDVLISILGNNESIVTRSTSHNTIVTNLGLNVADNGTFRDLVQRKDISDGQLSLLSGKDELTGVKTLRSANKGVDSLESVGILELDGSDRGTSSRVVVDVLYNTLGIAVSFGKVLLLESNRALAADSVGFVDGSLASTTILNDLSHFESINRII
jgi:hypothetical protein